jgi:hypothetical protein
MAAGNDIRSDANRIALRAIRTILDGATAVTLKVHGKDVERSLQRKNHPTRDSP